MRSKAPSDTATKKIVSFFEKTVSIAHLPAKQKMTDLKCETTKNEQKIGNF